MKSLAYWHTMSEQPTPPPENAKARTVLTEEQGRLCTDLHKKVENIRIAVYYHADQVYSGAPILPPLAVTPDTLVAEALEAFAAYADAGGNLSLLPFTPESIARYLPALRRRYADRSICILHDAAITKSSLLSELRDIARDAVAALPRKDPVTIQTRQSLSDLLRYVRRSVTAPLPAPRRSAGDPSAAETW